jgi:hypothetical protein
VAVAAEQLNAALSASVALLIRPPTSFQQEYQLTVVISVDSNVGSKSVIDWSQGGDGWSYSTCRRHTIMRYVSPVVLKQSTYAYPCSWPVGDSPMCHRIQSHSTQGSVVLNV